MSENLGTSDDPWQLRLVTPLHMTRDAASFAAAPAPGLLPLWEAKHAGLLDKPPLLRSLLYRRLR